MRNLLTSICVVTCILASQGCAKRKYQPASFECVFEKSRVFELNTGEQSFAARIINLARIQEKGVVLPVVHHEIRNARRYSPWESEVSTVTAAPVRIVHNDALGVDDKFFTVAPSANEPKIQTHYFLIQPSSEDEPFYVLTISADDLQGELDLRSVEKLPTLDQHPDGPELKSILEAMGPIERMDGMLTEHNQFILQYETPKHPAD